MTAVHARVARVGVLVATVASRVPARRKRTWMKAHCAVVSPWTRLPRTVRAVSLRPAKVVTAEAVVVHAVVAHAVQKYRTSAAQRVPKARIVVHAARAAQVAAVVPEALAAPVAIAVPEALVVPVAIATIVVPVARAAPEVLVVVVPADLVVNVQVARVARADNVHQEAPADNVLAVSAQVVLVQAHVVQTRILRVLAQRLDQRMTRRTRRALTPPRRADKRSEVGLNSKAGRREVESHPLCSFPT